MLVTLKLQCNPPDLNEGFIRTVIKEGLPLIATIERMRSLEDGIVLVTVSSTNEKVFDNLYQRFPIAEGQLRLVQTWVHYPNTPSIVLLRNPPPGTNRDKLEAYLEGLEIYTEDIIQSEDDDSITVNLTDPLDLPFLVTKRHTMRRQPVVFLEASIPETNLSIKPINIQDNEEEERDFSSWSPQIVNQPAPTPLFYQKEQYISSYPTPPPRTTTTKGNNNIGAPHNGHHHYHCDTPLTNSALKIHVINNLLSDSFLESTIRHRYLQSPYHLTVDHILVTAGTAYVTFLEGLEKAVDNPLQSILGCPVECEVVPLESVVAFRSVPTVLWLKSLPDMTEERIKKRLERLFKNVGHVVEKCVVKGREAYVTFEDLESINALVNNPPDSSTLAGHAIIYTTANSTDIFEEKDSPHMLIVENLPDEWDEDLDEDFVSFMDFNTSFKMASYEVKDGKGYVHYENPEDAKKVAQTPPSKTFYGKSIQFRTEPLNKGKLVHTESVPDEMSSSMAVSSKGKKEIGGGRGLGVPTNRKSNTSPAASPVVPPPIKPRGVSDIIVHGVPTGLNDYYLRLYLEGLPLNLKCQEIQMNEGMVVVKLKDKIDIKTLQHSINNSPFPDSSVVLTVEPYRSTRYSTADVTDHPSGGGRHSSSSFSDTVVIEELPFGVKNWQLRIYLNSLGVKCVDIQMKEGNMAVIQMDKKTDIKLLQQKAMESPLPEGPLLIECPPSPLSSPNNTKPHSGELSLSRNYSRTLLIKEIPQGVQPYVVGMYLKNLSGAQCTDIQMKEDTAIVTLDKEIDVKDLRKRSLDEVFPEGNVVLNIESHKPTTCVLVIAEAPLPNHVLEVYCERFGKVDIEKRTDKEYILTFEEEGIHQLFLRKKSHIAGAHKFTVNNYNPLFNKTPSSSSIPPTPSPSTDVPPPIPPHAAYYSWPNCKVIIQPESHNYYMHFQKDINNELCQIEGELHVSLTALEIRPLSGAFQIDDWDVQVRRKIDTYKQLFESAELELPSQVSRVVLDFLHDNHGKYPDLNYKPHGNHLTLAGHTKTVRKLTDEIQKMVSEEIEITYKIDKPPRIIQYILKFARNEISNVQPRVDIHYSEDNPGSVTLHGVKKSLEVVKDISETKIKHSHTEIIPLTTSAYELLQSQRGKNKLKEVLDDLINSVFYMCEKTDTHLDYHYQLCILSPDSVACYSAKKRISSLIDEKRVQLAPQEREICCSHEWKAFVDTTTSRYFVSVIVVKNETILLTGNETQLREISDQITTFLNSQNIVTDNFFVSGPVWQLLSNLPKLKDVQKNAKYRKVKMTLPDSRNGDQLEVTINLSGEPRALEDMKAQLKMLIHEVNHKVFNIRPQPGLEKVVEKGMIRMRCLELEDQHKIVIKYAMEEVIMTPPAVSINNTAQSAPLRVLSGNGHNGIKVQVYTGDPTKKRCGALTMFVSKAPKDIDHPMMASLAAAGGADVQGSLRALTLRPRLIEATVHKSQSVGGLDCAEICYVVLPLYDSSSDPAGLAKLLEAGIQRLLDEVVMNHPDIILTPLTAPPHKYPTELYAQSVLTALATTNLGIYNDVQVTIFIEKEEQKTTFHTKMKELGFVIDYVHASKGRRANEGGFKVQVLQGDVTKTHCGALVNSTAIDMRYNSNTISKAIHAAAGPDLRKACQSLVDQDVLLKDGLVVPTPACGSLRCNTVIHAHMPGKLATRTATKEQTDKLKLVVLNCLRMAEEEGQSSIAMSAFCLGIGNFSVPESAKPTLEAIQEFTMTKPTILKQVDIVILDQKNFTLFRDWFEDHVSNKLNIPTSKMVSSSGSEGISTTLSIAALPNRGRLDTATTNTAQITVQKKYKLTFNLYGLNEDTLADSEMEIIKYINELIVDDMVDLGEMTSLLSESDLQDIYELANREGVAVTVDCRLNRILVNGEERAVERVCNLIQKNVVELTRLLQELHMFEWMAQNADGTVESYNLEAAQQLEVAFKRQLGVVKLVIDNIACTVDLNNWEEKEDVAGTTKTVLRNRKQYVEYPNNWDLSAMGKEVVTFIDIPETSDEYNKATNRFLDTIGVQCDISKVQRVQNPSEFTRYQSLKKSWVMLHGVGCVTEKELFHGTKKENLTPICSTGFNRGYAAESNAARYGKGVYFALNASYSMQEKYAMADKEGYKYILVCSLLVCKTTLGNEKIKVPPPLPNNPQVVYDTLVEKLTNPTIFVAMKDSQAYPKYVIMFKKRV